MASILTNTSAMAAIQTLRGINNSLERVQSQVSSGLRIGQASDNAAYWSIATTMRSDNMAISAVQDALGLGAAKVSVAYAGMESSVSVLSEYKARLVAAKEDGVDKAKIQEELNQFKDQLFSIADSASFSGENWLSTDILDIHDTALNRALIVSSFVRSSDGAVKVNTTDINLWNVSLINSSGGGILQVDERSPGTIGGLALTDLGNSGSRGAMPFSFDGPLQFDDASTTISFDIIVDADDPASGGGTPGQLRSITINRADVDTFYPANNGLLTTPNQFAAIIQSKLAGSGAQVYAPSSVSIQFITQENTGLRGSSIQILNLSSTLVDGKTGGLADMATPSYGTRAGFTGYWDGPFRLHEDVKLFVPIRVNGVGGIDEIVEIDRAFLDGVLGKTTGRVETASELTSVINAAFDAYNLGVNAVGSGNSIWYSLDPLVYPESGIKTTLEMWPTTHNLGAVVDFNIEDVDITAAGANIDYYINGIEKMLYRAVHGASVLGSIERRIDLQKDFASSLRDSIASGIGRLVDADMNEASTKLKAEQARQQLAIQSLHIANSNAETILTLFR